MKKLALIIATAIITLAGVISYTVTAADTNSFDNKQTHDIENIVHKYLVAHPEVIEESVKALQQQQKQVAEKKAITAISLNSKSLIHDPASPSFGNIKGKIAIVEFLDYQCKHCKTMSPIIQTVVSNNKDVKFVAKLLPLFGSSSQYASKAGIAAYQLDPAKFSVFHSKLLAEKSGLSTERVLALAKASGYDINKLKAQMNSKSTKAVIKENFKLAQAIGLQGTPAFIISDSKGGKSTLIAGRTSKASLEAAIKKISS